MMPNRGDGGFSNPTVVREAGDQPLSKIALPDGRIIEADVSEMTQAEFTAWYYNMITTDPSEIE